MSKFVYNPHSGTPRELQWKAFLQQQEHTDDIVRAIESSAKEDNERSKAIEEAVRTGAEQVGETVAAAALAQIQQARINTAEIVGTLEVTSTFIADRIDSLGRTLNPLLIAMTYQQRVGNFLLADIRDLMRIPDFQKERLHYTEVGLKHFKNAAKDPSFYAEALDALLKAEEREKTDFVILYTIGMIYTYSAEFCNLHAAETYFLRAARYAAIEEPANASRIAAILWTDVRNLPDTLKKSPKRSAIEALKEAAYVCYMQGKFALSVEHIRGALEMSPDYLPVRFKLSKYAAAAGNGNLAASNLEQVVRSDRNYADDAMKDDDLVVMSEVRSMLKQLRDEAAQRLESDIVEIQGLQAPSTVG